MALVFWLFSITISFLFIYVFHFFFELSFLFIFHLIFTDHFFIKLPFLFSLITVRTTLTFIANYFKQDFDLEPNSDHKYCTYCMYVSSIIIHLVHVTRPLLAQGVITCFSAGTCSYFK